MNDPFETILKQPHCIADSEETVKNMDSLRSENVKLRQIVERLIEAGEKAMIPYDAKYLDDIIARAEFFAIVAKYKEQK